MEKGNGEGQKKKEGKKGGKDAACVARPS